MIYNAAMYHRIIPAICKFCGWITVEAIDCQYNFLLEMLKNSFNIFECRSLLCEIESYSNSTLVMVLCNLRQQEDTQCQHNQSCLS